MIIKNRFLVKIMVKIFNLPVKRIRFIYEKEIYDPDLTQLAFLNQSLHEFDEDAASFRKQINEAIQKIT